MQRVYVDKAKVSEALAAITAAQEARNVFVNVAVKPYKGKKYNPENTAVIAIG